MATHRYPIVGFQPGTSGNSWYEPVNIKASTSWARYQVLVMNNTASSRHGGTAIFNVPENYPASPTLAQIQVVYTSDVTSGVVALDVDVTRVRAGESFNTASVTQSVTLASTVPGTAHTRSSSPQLLTLTANNFAKNDLVQIGLFRDKTDAADTCTGFVIVHHVLFVYND